jgi:hypothetical protein
MHLATTFLFYTSFKSSSPGYLPKNPHKEIPQHSDLAKGVDPVVQLKEAARILDCGLDHFRRSSLISKVQRDNRNLLVFSV